MWACDISALLVDWLITSYALWPVCINAWLHLGSSPTFSSFILHTFLPPSSSWSASPSLYWFSILFLISLPSSHKYPEGVWLPFPTALTVALSQSLRRQGLIIRRCNNQRRRTSRGWNDNIYRSERPIPKITLTTTGKEFNPSIFQISVSHISVK